VVDMINAIFKIGIAQQMGVFFFLFIVLGALFWMLIRSIMKQNNERENRYIATIDKLADSLTKVESIQLSIVEMRKDITESNNRQESMIGRVLDRLPAKRL
jgi:cbb3-type cytochrome oxidase subunit 3